MANIESNTLLEKLSKINTIKNRIRQKIIDIGGGDYINEQTPFASFPLALDKVFSDIHNSSKLLQYINEGGDLEEIDTKDDLTYDDVLPYISDIMNNKQLLVDNLRTKGVLASIDESLESLINKILKIEGTSNNDNNDDNDDNNNNDNNTETSILYETTLTSNNYSIKYQVTAREETYEGNTNYLINHIITNTSSSDILGVMIKNIFTDSGNTELVSFVNTLSTNIGSTIAYGYDITDYENVKKRYSSTNTISQLEVLDDCTFKSKTLSLSKFNYSADAIISYYYSNKLGAYAVITEFSIPDDSDYIMLSKGLFIGWLNEDDKSYGTIALFGNENAIYRDGKYWSDGYGTTDNVDNIKIFATIYDNYPSDWSYDNFYELYQEYIK